MSEEEKDFLPCRHGRPPWSPCEGCARDGEVQEEIDAGERSRLDRPPDVPLGLWLQWWARKLV